MSRKKNPNKIQFTMADMKLAEKRWQRQLDEMKVAATSDATKYVQAVSYLALIHAFGWTTDELIILQAEMERISEKMLSPDYGFDEVLAELLQHNVEIT